MIEKDRLTKLERLSGLLPCHSYLVFILSSLLLQCFGHICSKNEAFS